MIERSYLGKHLDRTYDRTLVLRQTYRSNVW